MRAPRILLIAGDGETHRGLSRRLRRRGCEVFEAGTEPEALRMVPVVEPDLVVEEHAPASTHRPRAFDEVLAAIEILAGPLPRHPRRAACGAHRRGWGASPRPRALPAGHARHRRG